MFSCATKIGVYLALMLLAYACIQTANGLSKDSCKCTRMSLIGIIVGLTALATSILYKLSLAWTLLSLIPMISGFAALMIVRDVELHRSIDNFIKIIVIARVVSILKSLVDTRV